MFVDQGPKEREVLLHSPAVFKLKKKKKKRLEMLKGVSLPYIFNSAN